jgi:DNA polymerase elongation subunit (family B)
MSGIFTMRIIYFDSYLLRIVDEERYLDTMRRDRLMMGESIKLKIYERKLYNEFMKRDVEYVPIIRLFGTTLRGQKCCLNIHTYFPYFYIEINRDNYFEIEDVGKRRQFANVLEKVYLRYITNKTNLKENKITQVIHNMEIVSKYGVYGYSKEKSQFLKVYVYDPKSVKILMQILHSCTISSRYYQCYEAHISYSMHFFADNDLYGMGLISCKNYSFRYDIPNKVDCRRTVQLKNLIWDENTIEYEEAYYYESEMLRLYDYTNLLEYGKTIWFNNIK